MAAAGAADWSSLVVIVSATVGAIALVMNLIINIRGGVWHTAGREQSLKSEFRDAVDGLQDEFRNAVDGLRSETTQNLAELNRDMNEGFKSTLNQFGETVRALRERVHSNELYSEREFLRKQEFYEFNRNATALREIDKKMDARFTQQDKNIHELLGRVRGDITGD